jgi:alkanesulfonate monooxygenase SsuD/methylene tetrahydromethanopterin reductase-like flavin-dependent oxidoreductase (luciferase family)
MKLGVHLPLIDLAGESWILDKLARYTEEAEQLGFAALAQNDHFLYPRPWLDGPVALAAVLHATARMLLFTSVFLPVLRGPVPAAKTLAALDLLSGGRMRVAVGPGSSAGDYRAVGVPFNERWTRADESVAALRSLFDRNGPEFSGTYYTTAGVKLEPYPLQQPGPPIWIGSWGSDAGLRRTARIGDGWLASAYNTTPERFGDGLRRLNTLLESHGRSAAVFPNAISSMFCYFTEDAVEAESVLSQQVAPALGRSPEELRDRILVGSPEVAVQRLSAYRDAGAQLVFLWPVRDEIRQIELISKKISPHVS